MIGDICNNRFTINHDVVMARGQEFAYLGYKRTHQKTLAEVGDHHDPQPSCTRSRWWT